MLQPIEIENPVVIPAKPQQVFDLLWVRSLTIDLPGPNEPQDKSICNIAVCPMSQSGELFDNLELIKTSRLLEAAAEVPEIANAINAVVAAIPALKNWIKARS